MTRLKRFPKCLVIGCDDKPWDGVESGGVPWKHHQVEVRHLDGSYCEQHEHEILVALEKHMNDRLKQEFPEWSDQ